MLEVNLLPWREQRRQARRKFWVVLAVVALLILGVVLWSYLGKKNSDNIAAIPPENTTVVAPEQPLPEIKFVGLMQQGTRTWGLVTVADGTTHDVQVGTKIPGIDAWVVSINASEMEVKVSNQQHYVLEINKTTPHRRRPLPQGER
ncbi:MAG: pilus assembly protein PilP [Pseudomonadota bacterium]